MRRLSGLVERADPTKPVAAGDDAWRTMSDTDLAKLLDFMRKRTKALLDLVVSVAPSAREVDRGEMDEAYPEMQKLVAGIVSDLNALT